MMKIYKKCLSEKKFLNFIRKVKKKWNIIQKERILHILLINNKGMKRRLLDQSIKIIDLNQAILFISLKNKIV